MITGYLCLVTVLLLLIKFIVRKAGWEEGKLFFRKIHKPLGIAVIVIVLFHMVCTFSVWDTRNLSVMISGIILGLFVIGMGATYFFQKKLDGKWMQWHRMIAILIVIAIGSHIILYYIDFFSYQKKIESIVLSSESAENVTDGSFIGEYDAGYIYALVRVDVKDQRIVGIDLLAHDNERGTRAEAVLSEIVKGQTTKVDAVSGATNSSKVLMKAVENALEKGRR